MFLRSKTGTAGALAFALLGLVSFGRVAAQSPDPGGLIGTPGVGSLLGAVVDAASGAPVGGAHVVVGGIVTVAPIMTDEAGMFEVAQVPAGERPVLVFKAGYEPAREIALIEDGARTSLTISLRPLPEPAAGAVAGVVTDAETGRPVAGAIVNFLPARPEMDPIERFLNQLDEFPHMPHATTGEDGRYEIPRLPVGPYHIRARAPGYAPSRSLVEVAAGEVARADFALDADGTPRPVGPGAIRGRVVDSETGRPIGDAAVFVRPHFPAPEGDPNVSPGRLDTIGLMETPRVHADALGLFRIAPLIPSGYELIARAPGYRPEARPAAVRSGEETEVLFRLVRDGEPTETGAVGGAVYDGATQAGIAGAIVTAIAGDPADGSIMPREVARAVTGPDGRYLIPELPPGRYVMVAGAEGYLPADAPVEIVAGDLAMRDFVLRPGAPPENGAVAGTVRNGDPRLGAPIGPPITGAVVRWAAANSPMGEPPTTGGETTTDEEGVYLIPDLPPGLYVVAVSAPGFLPADRLVPVGPGETSRADFPLIPEDLHVGGAIEGVVTNGDPNLDGSIHPIAGATVALSPLAFPAGGVQLQPVVVRTGPDGRYRAERLPAGAWAIRVEADGFQPAEGMAEIRAGETSVANFALRPRETNAPAVTGHVGGTSGPLQVIEPIPGARIFVLEPDPTGAMGTRRLVAETGPDGAYAIPAEALPAPAFVLVAEAQGWRPSEPRPVTLAPGQTAVVDFSLVPETTNTGAAIAGRVVGIVPGSDGTVRVEPIAGARVEYSTPLIPTLLPLFVETDREGRYAIPNVGGLAGVAIPDLTLNVTAQGFAPQSRVVPLVAGETVRADFEMRPAGPNVQ